MASCLLKSECVDLSRRLYNMTWWATALNQITVPSGMNMCGGSLAIITTSGGVSTYRYNGSTWKQEDSIDSISSDISSLGTRVSDVETATANLQNNFNVIQYAEISAGSNYDFTDLQDNSNLIIFGFSTSNTQKFIAMAKVSTQGAFSYANLNSSVSTNITITGSTNAFNIANTGSAGTCKVFVVEMSTPLWYTPPESD